MLYGSQNGTAQDYAETVYLESTMASYEATIKSLNEVILADGELDGKMIKAHRLLVIVISNTGDGDPPDTATSFWRWLTKDNQEEARPFEGCRIALLGN